MILSGSVAKSPRYNRHLCQERVCRVEIKKPKRMSVDRFVEKLLQLLSESITATYTLMPRIDPSMCECDKFVNASMFLSLWKTDMRMKPEGTISFLLNLTSVRNSL